MSKKESLMKKEFITKKGIDNRWQKIGFTIWVLILF
jgi:hypothetical protein